MTRDALDGRQDAVLQDHIDALCDRFEAEWRGGRRPSLAEFVRESRLGEDPEGRAALLQQLIAIDLWYCWGSSGPGETTSVLTLGDTPPQGVSASTVVSLPDRPLLDDYVRCFPELGSLEALPDDLVVREYEARCRQSGAPDSADYGRRFGSRPGLAERLRELDSNRRPRTPGGHGAGMLDGQGAGRIAGGWDKNGTRPGPGEVREFGEYDILEQIGHGGMGVVFKARQRAANRVVALKMILAGQLAGEEEVLTKLKSLSHVLLPPFFNVHVFWKICPG